MKYLKYVDINGRVTIIFVHQITSMQGINNEQTVIHIAGFPYTFKKPLKEVLDDLGTLVMLKGND